jgi:hypothetical protein
MILYFDTFVTDSPLFSNKKMDDLMQIIRPENSSYRNTTKTEIFRYTLESFLDLNFDKISINVEFENEIDRVSFQKFYEGNNTIRISNKRSDSKQDYLEHFKNFEDNEWCFFSPNNDHPFIANDPEILKRLEEQANCISQKYNSNVTIFYSHFTENLNIFASNKYLHSFSNSKVKFLEETKDCYVVEFPTIQFISIQILKVGFLKELFLKVPDDSSRLIRLEDIAKYIAEPIPVISMIPKTEICRHFDTYVHTIFHYSKYIKPQIVPPLFIPDGFFDRNIKIKYGYDYIYSHYININPNKSIYSFQNPDNGFDLLCRLEDLPLSWKKRISSVDVSKDFVLNEFYLKRDRLLRNPWGNLNAFQSFFYNFIRNVFNAKLYKFKLYFFNRIFWRYKLKQVLK